MPQPQAQASSPPPTPSPAPVATNLPTVSSLASRNLLKFDSQGQLVAAMGEGNNVSVHDVATKAIVRNAFNESLAPTAIAVDANRGLVAVGGEDGSAKVFPLTSTRGLDRFAQDSLVRRDRNRPYKAHANSLASIAINPKENIFATGDISGEVRLWSSDDVEAGEFVGAGGGVVAMRAFQNERVLFGATRSNKVVFWKEGNPSGKPEEFASLANRPVHLQPGPGGKGLAVGDDTGRITFWAADGGNLSKQSFHAHSSAVAGLSFTGTGDSLITASRSGDILRWKLPLERSEVISLNEPPRFVGVSGNGRVIAVPSRKSHLDLYSSQNQSLLRSHSVAPERRVSSGAFTRDDRMTVVGDDVGNISFFGTQESPVSYLNVGESSLEYLVPSKRSDETLFAFKDGSIGVVANPSIEPLFIPADGVVDAVASPASKTVLVVCKKSLILVDSEVGAVVRSVPYGGPTISSAYLDSVVAVVGTTTGEVWWWQHAEEGAQPEQAFSLPEKASISGIGLTESGEVVTCIQSGQLTVTSLQKQNPPKDTLTGQIKAKPTKVVPVADGGFFALGERGEVFKGNVLSKTELIPLLKEPTESFADISVTRNSLFALTIDRKQLIRLDLDGNEIHRISTSEKKTGIDQFSGGDRCAAILSSDGQPICFGESAEAQSESVVATGAIGGCWLARDGSYVAKTAEGAFYRGSGDTPSKPLSLADGAELLAISPSGRQGIIGYSDGAKLLDFESGRLSASVALANAEKPLAACFSSNEQFVFIASESGNLFRFDRNDPSNATNITNFGDRASQLKLNTSEDSLLVHGQSGRIILIKLNGGVVEKRFDSQEQTFRSSCIGNQALLLGSNDGIVSSLVENNVLKQIANLGKSPIEQIVLNREQTQFVAITGDQRIHCFSLREGVWVSRPAQKSDGRCLSLQHTDKGLVSVDTNGRYKVLRQIWITPLTGPNVKVQQVCVSQNGKWVLALDPRGKIGRWSIGPNGPSKPMRVSIDTPIKVLTGLAQNDHICLVGAEAIFEYSPTDDRVLGSIDASSTDQVSLQTGNFPNVVVRDGSQFRLADLGNGSIRGLPVSPAFTGLMQVKLTGRSTWVAFDQDGQYKQVDSGSGTSNGSQYTLGFQPTSSRFRNDLLLSYNDKQLAVSRPEGSVANRFQLKSPGQILSADLASIGGLTAIVDNNRMLTIVDRSKALRSVLIPFNGAATAVKWDQRCQNLVVAIDQSILVFDANSLKLKGISKVPIGIKEFANWVGNHLLCITSDNRLAKLQIPQLLWSARLPSAPTAAAWSSGEREAVFAIDSGTLFSYSAENGELVDKTESGKTGVRAICQIGNSDRLAMLAGASFVITLDSAHKLGTLAVSSPIPLTGLATELTGNWVYTCNSAGEVYSWDITSAKPAPKLIPCELRCNFVKPIDGGLIAGNNSLPTIASLAAKGNNNSLGRINGTIEDFALLPDDSFAVIADGTSTIHLVNVAAKESKKLLSDATSFSCVAVHPRGLRIVAGGNSLGKANGSLTFWDTDGLKVISQVEVPKKPTDITYAPDGSLVAASLLDGECHIFDGSTGTFLESVPPVRGLSSISFSADSRRLLLGREDGVVQAHPLRSLGILKASTVGIWGLQFSPTGKHLLLADYNGNLQLRLAKGLSSPAVELTPVGGRVIQSKFSTDGLWLAVAAATEEHAVYLWNMAPETGVPTAPAPSLVIKNRRRQIPASDLQAIVNSFSWVEKMDLFVHGAFKITVRLRDFVGTIAPSWISRPIKSQVDS